MVIAEETTFRVRISLHAVGDRPRLAVVGVKRASTESRRGGRAKTHLLLRRKRHRGGERSLTVRVLPVDE
jgi:hypothetical protein